MNPEDAFNAQPHDGQPPDDQQELPTPPPSSPWDPERKTEELDSSEGPTSKRVSGFRWPDKPPQSNRPSLAQRSDQDQVSNDTEEEVAPGEQPNNPLHGVKLADILEYLVEQYGWEELGFRIDIRCFNSNPSIKSSLKFLRQTQWARDKVERLYLRSIRKGRRQ